MLEVGVPPPGAPAGDGASSSPGAVGSSVGSAASISACIPAVLTPALLHSVAEVVGLPDMVSSFSSLHILSFSAISSGDNPKNLDRA